MLQKRTKSYPVPLLVLTVFIVGCSTPPNGCFNKLPSKEGGHILTNRGPFCICVTACKRGWNARSLEHSSKLLLSNFVNGFLYPKKHISFHPAVIIMPLSVLHFSISLWMLELCTACSSQTSRKWQRMGVDCSDQVWISYFLVFTFVARIKVQMALWYKSHFHSLCKSWCHETELCLFWHWSLSCCLGDFPADLLWNSQVQVSDLCPIQGHLWEVTEGA